MTKRRRSQQAARRFEARAGHTYAIESAAFFDFFTAPESRDNERIGSVEIIDIDGPLEQHAGGWCDSYEAILGRVAAACEGDARSIVLRVDSPGGDCAGIFDAARKVRASCIAARKPLFAYVTDKACSAGYALAAAATHGITLSDSAIVGSIGVISTREDVSAMNAARGLRVELIASGARKADGHPDAPITDEEIVATKLVIDSVAGVFFALVEEMRGVSASTVAAFEAGVFHGEAAIGARLADSVQSFDSMIAAIAKGANMAAEKTPYEVARENLEEAAKGDDANAAAAKRALAAMDEGGGGDDDTEETDTEEETAEADDDDKKAEADDDKTDDDPPPKGKESARGVSSELTALAEVHKLRAEYNADKVAAERARLIASRRDFAPEMIKALSKRSTSIETVRDMVANLPKGAPVKKPSSKGAVTTLPGVRGEGQTSTELAATPETAEMDRAMGLTQTTLGTRREGNHALILGVMEKKVERPAATSGAGGGAK